MATKVAGHYLQVLSHFSQEKYRDRGDYVWKNLFPLVSVEKLSDEFAVWDLNPVELDIAAAVPDSVPPPLIVGDSPTTDSYLLKRYRLASRMEKTQLSNEDAIIRTRKRHANKILKLLNLGAEKRVIDTVLSTDNMDLNGAASTAWNNDAADIEKMCDVADEAVYDETGVITNKIVMNWSDWLKLKYNPRIRKLLDEQNKVQQIENPQVLRKLFGKDLIISTRKYNSANRGQTASYADLWTSGKILFAYVAPEDEIGVDTMTLGATFQGMLDEVGELLQDPSGEGGVSVYMNEYDMQPVDQTRTVKLVGEILQQEKLLDANCGYLMTSCIE